MQNSRVRISLYTTILKELSTNHIDPCTTIDNVIDQGDLILIWAKIRHVTIRQAFCKSL